MRLLSGGVGGGGGEILCTIDETSLAGGGGWRVVVNIMNTYWDCYLTVRDECCV